jgi:hypothetical protein
MANPADVRAEVMPILRVQDDAAAERTAACQRTLRGR